MILLRLSICLSLLWIYLAEGSRDGFAQTASATKVKKRRLGPWGELESFYTYLEPPSHIMDMVNTPSQRTIWVFPRKSIEEVGEFLNGTGLSGPVVTRILQTRNSFQNGPWIRLYPSPETVENLSPECRIAIYQELGKHKENPNYRFPVIIESGNVKEWFERSGLSNEVVSYIEKLSYKIGQTRAFSDTPLLMLRSKSDKEERRILKNLARTRSLIVRLKLTPQSDFTELKKYWTSGRGPNAQLPLLESYEGKPDVNYIDLIHLLPPTPRKHLYSFPSSEQGLNGIFPDSFWIAFNFYYYLPADSFEQPATIAEYLRSYNEVSKPYQFGDVLLIGEKGTNRVFHACVYLADEIVYTKNGRSVLTPFMLMEFENLLSRVSFGKETVVRAFRRKLP